MIQATAHAGTFVRVFEERAVRAQYLLHGRLTRAWRGAVLILAGIFDLVLLYLEMKMLNSLSHILSLS